MAQEILQSANRIVVPPRAGELIVARLVWDVAVKSNADTVVIGYLPAGCKLHAPASQIYFDAAVPNCDVDLLLVDTSNVLINTGAHTTATATRVAMTTYELAETLGVSESNRAILLLLNTAPASAAGNIIADVAYFAP
jgi:hypothetical protein